MKKWILKELWLRGVISPDTYSRISKPKITVPPFGGTERDRLRQVHEMRLRDNWGKGYNVDAAPWPKTEAEWRQTPHGAPWDTNVHMAQWHLDFARKLRDAGLL